MSSAAIVIGALRVSKQYVLHVCMEATFVKICLMSTGSHDGWMTCDFASFSTVFQLYQDDDNERLCAMEPRLRLNRHRH